MPQEEVSPRPSSEVVLEKKSNGVFEAAQEPQRQTLRPKAAGQRKKQELDEIADSVVLGFRKGISLVRRVGAALKIKA